MLDWLVNVGVQVFVWFSYNTVARWQKANPVLAGVITLEVLVISSFEPWLFFCSHVFSIGGPWMFLHFQKCRTNVLVPESFCIISATVF
jgi:hypothetical protein